MAGLLIKGKIGYEDIEFGTGTFDRYASTGSLLSLHKLGAKGYQPWPFGCYIDLRDHLPEDFVIDGTVDYTTEIQAAITAAESAGGTVFIPKGIWKITSTLIVNANNVKLQGVGYNSSIIRTAENIAMLQIGDYSYTGVDDWAAGDYKYYPGVDGINFDNTSAIVTTSIGIALKGATYGSFSNLRFSGGMIGIGVYPISSWNSFHNILGHGTSMKEVIKVIGDGFSAGYNSTGNIYNLIRGVSVTEAVIYVTGAVFGDMVITNVIGYGNAATAGIWLQSTGTQLYATKISICGLDMDGTADYGLWAQACSGIEFIGVNVGGTVTTPVLITGGTHNQAIIADNNQLAGKLGIGATPTYPLQVKTNEAATDSTFFVDKYLTEFATGVTLNSTNDGISANKPMEYRASSHVFNAGPVGIGMKATTTFAVSSLPSYPNNAAALVGGLTVGDCYRTGGDPDTMAVVH